MNHIELDLNQRVSQKTQGFHTGSGTNSKFVEAEIDPETDIEVNFDAVKDYPPIDVFDVEPAKRGWERYSNHKLAEGIGY